MTRLAPASPSASSDASRDGSLGGSTSRHASRRARLVLGADRDSVRVILDRNGQIVDETISTPASERSELTLIEPVLARHGVDWTSVDAFGVLILPHSHTSVRITTTLATVAGWLADRPVVHIDVPELTSASAQELLANLTTESPPADEEG